MTEAVAADLDRRFYACAIDRTVVWGLAAAAAVAVGRAEAAIPTVGGVAVLVEAVLAIALGLTGGSPGKAIAGLRVVREGSGTPIGVPAALGRQVVLIGALLPTLGLGAAGLAWTVATDAGGRRRGWHDHLVGSVVVDARPLPAEEPVPEPPQLVNLTALHLGPAPDPPPTRWRVGFDSGESLLVEGLVLIGRRPEPRPGERVRHLVRLASADMSLSKTHAQLQVAADGALVVMDRGSTNGSVLVRGVPRGLPSGRAATLLDGDRVRFGDREMSVSRLS